VTNRPLEGRCALITGASQGLGLEIARRYLAAGAHLMICAREETTLAAAARELEAAAQLGQIVLARSADVASAADVSMLAGAVLQAFGRVDILVNNAAVTGPCGELEEVDWSEWMKTIQVNLFGPVMLSRALLPHFKRAGKGKIIQLSGGGATGPFPMLSAYAVSKAAVIRFVETLAEEVRSHCIDVNAIAPGMLNTRMLNALIDAGPKRIGQAFFDRALKSRESGGVPLAQGADLAVFLGSAKSDGITGKLLSAVWDPWNDLPEHLADLRETDVYTLRRIVPKDRNLPWGEMD
jgi:NAD(P)-dependent dehydrogenase (short-subunit alcohol dehydrogenase family)